MDFLLTTLQFTHQTSLEKVRGSGVDIKGADETEERPKVIADRSQ
jgi:hypothetical protein